MGKSSIIDAGQQLEQRDDEKLGLSWILSGGYLGLEDVAGP